MQCLNLDDWHDSSVALLMGHNDPRTSQRFYAGPQVALLKRLGHKFRSEKLVNLSPSEGETRQKNNYLFNKVNYAR